VRSGGRSRRLEIVGKLLEHIADETQGIAEVTLLELEVVCLPVEGYIVGKRTRAIWSIFTSATSFLSCFALASPICRNQRLSGSHSVARKIITQNGSASHESCSSSPLTSRCRPGLSCPSSSMYWRADFR